MENTVTKGNAKRVTEKTILKRAEALYNVLKVLHEKEGKKMHKEEFMKLLKKSTNAGQNYSALVKHNIISGSQRGKRESYVHYSGMEPNIVACKKIIEYVVELGREWNRRFQEKHGGKRNVTSTATVEHKHVTAVVDKEPKLAPLHYNNFLKEIAILKERYALTVPNAHIEINVRVSSNTTV
jgi:hypothetical protein